MTDQNSGGLRPKSGFTSKKKVKSMLNIPPTLLKPMHPGVIKGVESIYHNRIAWISIIYTCI